MPRGIRGARNRELFIRTEITAPVSAGTLVSRPRLTELLEDVARARVTIVQAPAGYGKSTPLLQWYQDLGARHEKVAWLSLDAADRDPRKLLAYVVEALEVGESIFDPMTRSLSSAGAFVAPDVLMAAIINGLANTNRSVFLFVDDLHHLVEPAAQAMLALLIERLPDNVHIVAASREVPFLRVACTRARGQLLEIDAELLRFDRDEISRFLSSSGLSDVDPGTLAAIETRTEGWIASA